MNSSGIDAKLPDKKELSLWFEFMKLSRDSPAQWRIKSWVPELENRFGPRQHESFDGWCERIGEDLELLPMPPLVEHRSAREFNDYFVEGEYSLHLSVNLYMPKAEIKKAFARVLNEAHTERGFSRSAAFQLNGPVNVNSLTKVLAVLEAKKAGIGAIDIARNVLHEKLPGKLDADQSNTVHAKISRFKRRGLLILNGVVEGCFPDPDRPANCPFISSAPPPTSASL